MKELVETIARALADKPEEVRVNALREGSTVVLELSVAPEDLGRVIGKEGRTARAMRALLSAAAAKRGEKAVLKVLD